jgi:outer membrane receptor protein involved in Fe transport
MKRRFLTASLGRLPLAALLLALAALAARAQEARVTDGSAFAAGSVSGSILKPANGKATEGLAVTILETGQSTKTDKYGQFVFSNVRPGTYTILATGDGYSRLRITDVVVSPNHSLTLSPQEMPIVFKDGEVQMMEEVIVSAKKEAVEVMEKYLVTDTRQQPFTGTNNIDIPRSVNDVQPYYMWDASKIETSGATDIQSFFQRMVPMDTSKISPIQSTGGVYMGSNISLGGLSGNNFSSTGTQNTLILVDGRPIANFYGTFGVAGQGDLNGIPLSSIDHIEVLPASSGAIYGAASAGGVVNVVLKQNYSGGEIRMTYDSPADVHAPTKSVSLSLGMNLEGGRTNIMLTAAYQTANQLTYQTRVQTFAAYTNRYYSLYPNGGQLRYLGVLNASGVVASTNSAVGLPQPVIFSANGSPLFAGNSAIAVQVPAGYSPGSGLAPLQANIGIYNLAHPNDAGPYGLQYLLTKAPKEKSIQIFARRKMTGWLEAYLQLGTASDIDFNPALGQSTATILVTVPATAPGNPFGQAVRVTGHTKSNFPPPYYTNAVEPTLSAGARISLPDGWKADIDYSWSGSFNANEEGVADSNGIQAAVTAGQVNVITDTSLHPVDLSPYHYIIATHEHAATDTLQVKAAGPLMKLWAGAPTVAVGLEHRLAGSNNGIWYTQYFSNLAVTGLPATGTLAQSISIPGTSESDNSGYAELTMPLVSGANGIPGVRQLDLQAAGRYDRLKEYATSPADEFIILRNDGSILNSPALLNGGPEPYTLAVTSYHSSNGTIGFRYKPVDDLLFRWSFSTSFVPPTFSQLRVPISTGTITQTTGAYPGVPTSSPWPYSSITDPALNATYTVPVISGGHPGLLPETSHNIDWGVVLEPKFLKGLRVSLDYTKVTKYNNIVNPSAALIIANAGLYPGRVTRGTPNAGQTVGPVVLIDSTAINAPMTVTSSYNIQLDYTLRTATAGTWSLSGTANSWQHYVVQSTVGGAFVEQLGNPYVSGTTPANGTGAALAKFKGNIGLDWTKGPLSIDWLARYVGPYTNGAQFGIGGGNPVQGTINGWVSGQIYHDVSVGYRFETAGKAATLWQKALSGTSVRLGIKDVFNALPPYDEGGVGYLWASYYGDLYLRDWYLTVKKQF